MGLLHVSKGEEPDRYIEIRKRVQHECESWRTKKEVTKGQPEVSTGKSVVTHSDHSFGRG